MAAQGRQVGESDDREVVAGLVHGLSVLLLDGPLRGLPPADREAVLDKLLVTIEQGLTGSMG